MLQENQNPLSIDPQQVKKLLSSSAGKQLLQLLNQDGGAALQQAAACLKSGNVAGAQSAVAPIMEQAQAQALLLQLEQDRSQ